MVEVFAMTVIALLSFGISGDSAEWQSDYGKALAATQADSRPLLVVLDNPSDPASAASENQLAAEGEQEELLNAYQRCHVDVSTDYGKKIADAFKAKEFPFAAIIDKTGSIVLCTKTGKVSDNEWQATLSAYQSGVKPMRVKLTSFFRGGEGIDSSDANPDFCPSCQNKALFGN